eukprot:CAMPEP_0116040280 /NCGR_PEP_ID=MMETSP0321-20121206/24262_1 /TAXON_ID=163516 /ORGANISM="Leptocylindrus danicus var. danicus, Strain B650" /LENGTH=149 /DNA_ID=CAMNT_0003520059 /DNA_START=179 /DNA_END=624 /DNA_ORIENTATION=-
MTNSRPTTNVNIDEELNFLQNDHDSSNTTVIPIQKRRIHEQYDGLSIPRRNIHVHPHFKPQELQFANVTSKKGIPMQQHHQQYFYGDVNASAEPTSSNDLHGEYIPLSSSDNVAQKNSPLNVTDNGEDDDDPSKRVPVKEVDASSTKKT